jgi:hypothetical protein
VRPVGNAQVNPSTRPIGVPVPILLIRWSLTAGLTILICTFVDGYLSGPAATHPPVATQHLVFSPMPPGPPGMERPENCRVCHEDAYRSWQTSMHAQAASGGLFPIGFRVEPRKWCGFCHSPAEPDLSKGGSRGVTCGSCHFRVDGIATARPVVDQVTPHRLVFDPSLRDGSLCARCHQFDFPLNPVVSQDTIHEWRSSGRSHVACASCHMPDRPGKKHSYPGSRDAAFLRHGIPLSTIISPAQSSLSGVEFDITILVGPVAAAHRVPTGDPFRVLVVAWTVRDVSGPPIESGQLTFSRQFRSGQDMKSAGQPPIDNRLFPGERRAIHRIRLVPGGRSLSVDVTATLKLLPEHLTRVKGFPHIQVETPFYFERIQIGGKKPTMK